MNKRRTRPLSGNEMLRLTLALALLLGTMGLVLYAATAAPGWREQNGERFYITASHTRATGLYRIDDTTYLFDETGRLVHGFYRLEGNTFYADGEGRVVKGVYSVDGVRYCFDPDSGAMITGFFAPGGEESGNTYYFGMDGKGYVGWLESGDARYYLAENGVMTRGLRRIDGRLYAFDEDGVQCFGWLDVGQARYYFAEDGGALASFQMLDGKLYYFDPLTNRMHRGFLDTSEEEQILFGDDGARGSGFTEYDGRTYYTDAYGVPMTGMYRIGESTYCFDFMGRMEIGWTIFDEGSRHFDPEGRMLVGWQEIEGERYYFDEAGLLAFDEVEIDGERYRFEHNGRFYSGWAEIDGEKHYFDDHGYPVSGLHTINGHRYLLENGVMQQDYWWLDEEGGEHYFGADGTETIGLWRDEEGVKRFFDENGRLFTGFAKVDGFTYYFNGYDGALIGTHVIDGEEYTFAANGILASELEH